MLDKCNEIWNKINNTLNTKFRSILVYDEEYIEAKVREFNGVIETNFLGDKIPKESMHYTCITCITIDSVMRMEKQLSAGLFKRMQIQHEKKQRCPNS